MDADSGYNQLKMHPPDEDKITFTTSRGISQEHKGHLPTDGKQDLQGTYREHHGGVRR